MKKTLLIVAIAATTAASCTKSEYLGNKNQKVDHSSPIEIGSSVGASTKASAEESAVLLSNRFIVYGQKTVGGVASPVFEEVPVTYNNGEWSYVAVGQALRYWDSNATKYDFIAISDGNERTLAEQKMAKVTAKTGVYENGFSIATVTADELAKIYTTSLKTVNQINFSSPVQFGFSNAAAKVRVAFYNAIPGYEVNVDKFKLKNGTDSENGKTVLQGTFYETAAYDVDITGAISLNGVPTTKTDIILGNGIVQCSNANQLIGKSITTATFDNNKKYTNVLPVMSAGSDIELTVTYRMISGHDNITRTCDIKVPALYAQWKANYAYTYIFKITDNDLHPITFSAVVNDPTNQEYVTTVDGDNPVNITVYSENSNLLANGGYKVGEVAYATVQNLDADYTVHVGYTDNPDINGSNAGSIITNWTERSKTTEGRYQIHIEHAGYYAIRVTWVDSETSVEKHAFFVFTTVA